MTPPPTPLPESLGRDWFKTTQGSVVLASDQTDTPTVRAALERLCQTYWYPPYVYIRRLGSSPPEAQDLTQAFFERVLEERYWQQVEQDKGRFRAFLLTALKRFLTDQRAPERAAERGGNKTVLSVDTQTAEERYRLEPVDTMSADRLYERRWAFTVLERARNALRQEFVAAGKGDLYERLNALEIGEANERSYAEIGGRFGLSESEVKSGVMRLRRRYGDHLRQEISQTVATAAVVDLEIRHLMAAIAD
jgi:DNA-directed RNA polymerase specialized sigma24 family protein